MQLEDELGAHSAGLLGDEQPGYILISQLFPNAKLEALEHGVTELEMRSR